MNIDLKQPLRASRWKRLPLLARIFGGLAVAFFLGFMARGGLSAWDEKLLQMPRGSFGEQTRMLLWCYQEIGSDYFRPCHLKVEELGTLIEEADCGEFSKRYGELVVSILLDGNECNAHLAQLARSTRPLPATNLPFRLRDLGVQDLGAIVETEGELAIWMLDRLNPNHRLTFLGSLAVGKYGETYSNPEVVEYWIAIAELKE